MKLKSRFLLIGALAIAPLLISAFYSHWLTRAHLEKQLREDILGLLQLALVPESIMHNNVRQVLRIMANSNDIQSAGLKDCKGLVQRLLDTQTDFVNLGATDRDGNVLCSGLPFTGNVSYADRRWFQAALEKNDMTPGEVLVGRISGQRSITFGYAPNAEEMKAARGLILYASLSMDWLRLLVQQAPLKPGWVAAVHGIDGHIVARYPDPEGLQGKTMTEHELIQFIRTRPAKTVHQVRGADSVLRIYGIVPLSIANGELYLVVGAPPALLLEAANADFRRDLLLLLLATLISAALAWRFIKVDFLKFSDALTQSISQLREGDLTARAGLSTPIIELREIAVGFDTMATELERLDHQRQESLREQRLAAMVFGATSDGLLITDAERRIIQVNSRFCEITGYTQSEVMGSTPSLLKSGLTAPEFYAAMWASIKQDGEWAGEIINRRKDGTLCPEWLAISTIKNEQDEVLHYIGTFTDLTQRKEQADRLAHLQSHDLLTGMPNRATFIDRLDQALRLARRSGESVAVFWIDLARFRVINDTFGHQTGDAALSEIGIRLQLIARSSDAAARLSADEFGIVLSGFHADGDVVTLARRVLETVREPMDLLGTTLTVTANIGISVFPKDGASSEDLLKAADVALARAKDAGSDTFRFFEPGMDIDAERRMRLEVELRSALAEGQLSLHYQPQIDLATGRICGTEALMRWTHPVMGPISPVEFIPLAEEASLIAPIGEWALRTACQQNRRWIDAGLPELPVAVNISGKQFHQSDLVAMIANVLAETGLPPRLLEIELTESAFIGDVVEAAAIVGKIKALGVLLALDDFGTGYSSLTYLSGFPFDKIKIDQSFVKDITTNPVNAAIATATIAMGRSLDLIVLAEGVETDAQMSFLRSRQCEAMQGFLFSKALPVDELTELLSVGRMLKLGAGETAQKQTILLVDDEPNILSALKRLLRRDGYEILTAESPAMAMELLAQHEVQVIVSDQRMPEMSGTEFLEKAKRMYPNTVRIILSGYTDLESITDAINRGAIYHFLTKPWDDEKIRSEVREAFRVAQGFSRGK